MLLKIVTQNLGLLVYWGSILRILKFPQLTLFISPLNELHAHKPLAEPNVYGYNVTSWDAWRPPRSTDYNFFHKPHLHEDSDPDIGYVYMKAILIQIQNQTTSPVLDYDPDLNLDIRDLGYIDTSYKSSYKAPMTSYCCYLQYTQVFGLALIFPTVILLFFVLIGGLVLKWEPTTGNYKS